MLRSQRIPLGAIKMVSKITCNVLFFALEIEPCMTMANSSKKSAQVVLIMLLIT